MVYYIYGISDCPSCLRACADLMEADLEYIFIEMDFAPSEMRSIRDRLQWPTFPIVVVKREGEEEVLGGYEQLKEHMRVP